MATHARNDPETLDEEFDREIRLDDDFAARDRLARGLWIAYREADTPPGHVIREHPDGRRELVRVGARD
jgi:hypothetical protein